MRSVNKYETSRCDKDEIRLFKKLLEVTKKDEKESFFLKIKKLL